MRGKWIVRLTVITLLAGLAIRVSPGPPRVKSALTPVADSPQATPPAIEKPSFDPATIVQRTRATVRDEGGALTAWAGQARVSWTAQGLLFETGDAPPWSYHLTGIRQGAIGYDVPPAQPTAQSTAVAYARPGGVTERYSVLDRGVEQLFDLAAPLGSGDLVLTGHVDTTMAGAPEPAGGLVFTHDGRQALSYGAATAFDAAGRSTPVAVAYAGGELTLTVPGPWLAGAAYPVTVDPYLSGDILISRGEEQQWYPAIAYNYSLLFPEWLVVWEDKRDGDWDIYAQRVDADGTIKGEVICVADSTDNLRRPAVTYDTTQNRYLVVWQDEGATKAIGARVLNLNGTPFAAAFDLTSGTIARTHPDVAYNPTADQYLVVWQYETAADDHNIWGRKVNPDGTTDGSTFEIITHPDDDLEPALVAYPAGQYLLVWTSDRSGTYNVVGMQLPSDATPQTTFQVSGGSGDERDPDLALNTSNGRALVVWGDSRDDPGDDSNWDIYGRQVYSDGSRPDAGFAICTAAGNQREPAVAHNWATGYQEYLVVWDGLTTIQGARVSGDASTVGAIITVSAIAGYERYPAVAFGGDRHLVAWTDFRSGFADIKGQRITRTGTVLGYEIGLSTGYLGQQQPAIAYSTQQQCWLVVWEDDRAGVRRINGQLVTRDGWILGQLIHIGTQGMGQYSPAVAYNSTNDEFMVVWADWRAGNYDVWAQRVDADDGSLHPEFQINTDPEWQWYPAIAYNPDAGQYLVAWSDRRNDPGGSDYDVYGRRLYANGSLVDASDIAISTRTGSQKNVAVAYNPAQRQYLVVWEDESMADTGIAGQRVRGSTPGYLEGINFDICTATGEQVKPSVACNTDTGEYLVAWQDRRSVSTYDIYGRRVSGTGTLLGDGDIAISTASQGQEDPHASYDPSRNRYFVCWADSRNAATAPDIYGQALSASGNLLFTAATENAPVWVYPQAQECPAASGDPDDGRALAVWQDERNGVSNNIYGRLGSPQDYTVHLPLVLHDD